MLDDQGDDRELVVNVSHSDDSASSLPFASLGADVEKQLDIDAITQIRSHAPLFPLLDLCNLLPEDPPTNAGPSLSRLHRP